MWKSSNKDKALAVVPKNNGPKFVKQKLLVIGYRAWGDWLYTIPVLPYLFDKYEVHAEINLKGYALLHNDPRFASIRVYTGYEGKDKSEYDSLFKARWEKVRKEVQPDVEINLNGTLEVECISERFQDVFHWPIGDRRAVFSHRGFYSAVFDRCGYKPEELDLFSAMYFSPEEVAWVEQWAANKKGKFVVVIPIAGSTSQKVFHNFEQVTMAILDKYPDALVYLAGDEACSKLVPQHDRIQNMCGGRVGIKQSVHIMKYVNLAVGPETGLMVAAGMFGTPKIILATTSSVYQMTQYHRNDFSIQSPIPCSPCHRAIYFEDDCETMLFDKEQKPIGPTCAWMFKTETIMERVDYVYRNLRRNVSQAVS